MLAASTSRRSHQQPATMSPLGPIGPARTHGPTARSRLAAHLRGRVGRRRSAWVARAPSEPPWT
eukprot:14198527-Alexandrium_andersonii.AAC.1